MTDHELVLALRKIEVPDRHACLGCGYEHNCGLHGCVILKEAISRIEAAQPPNAPLTPEELREMDWEPAWLEGAELGRNGREGYAILWYSKVEKYLCIWWPCEEYADIPRLELYGKTWLAYRRKPEEV